MKNSYLSKLRSLVVLFSAIAAMSFLTKASAALPLIYDTEITVVNNLEPLYFGICESKLSPEGKSICSIPVKINKGINKIFVPLFKNTYPVITSLSEEVYTCRFEDNLNEQAFYEGMKGITITLDSFIKNKNNNKVAVSCK